VTAPRLRRPYAIVLAVGLLAASVAPVGAADPAISVVIAASKPLEVTQGLPVGYPVTVTNNGTSTINHGTLTGTLSGSAANEAIFLGAYPAGSCSAAAVCDVGTLSGGGEYRVIFLYQAPTTPVPLTFKAEFVGGEGVNDAGGAAHTDTFDDDVTTTVVPTSPDSTHQYALREGNIGVSTGIGPNVGIGNPHGTKVTVPGTTEGAQALVEDRANPAASTCPNDPAITDPCFGQASFLSIGDGMVFDQTSPLKVEIRFDYSELPSGMTDKKLRVVHTYTDSLGNDAHDVITTVCNAAATNAPCYMPAVKQADKDLVITVYLLHNGNIRGW
jgi:hypothetical protein